MFNLTRIEENPILIPDPNSIWESEATFNGSVVQNGPMTYMVYRAIGNRLPWHGQDLNISTIGLAKSYDSVHFHSRRQLIYPQYAWDMFGCEDPRITYLNGKYYIFYTALSGYPFNADNIKVAVATTRDLQTIDSKHLVTPFNAKAMALFPGKIKGQMAAVLTVNTDKPPAKICLALFDNEAQMWSPDFWQKWYENLDEYTLPLLRSSADQVEVGAVPIKTKYGWLLIYSYIKNYMGGTGDREFGIEAVLLDLHNPSKILGRTSDLMLRPQEFYEMKGLVPQIIFPTGALAKNNKLSVYYGGADKVVAIAQGKLDVLIKDYLLPKYSTNLWKRHINDISLADMSVSIKHLLSPRIDNTWVDDTEFPPDLIKLKRFVKNPILTPRYELAWEAKAVFNPAAVYLAGRVHLIYRAMASDSTSYFGYASSIDGVTIDERLDYPVFIAGREYKTKQSGKISCEDPRITQIGNVLHMCYTVFDGKLPRVAMSTIAVKDFLDHRWNWSIPVLISRPWIDDKDACLLPKKIGGKYGVFHRINNKIYFDLVKDFQFKKDIFIAGREIMDPRPNKWDNLKVGIACPPIDVGNAWLLLYHGVSQPGEIYKVGAALLDYRRPDKILARLDYPIFEPKAKFELEGQVTNVVFPCGGAVMGKKLLVYYGGGDSAIGVASVNLSDLVKEVKKYPV